MTGPEVRGAVDGPPPAPALPADRRDGTDQTWGAQRRRRATGPRIGARGWLRWAWRQLTSMRSALLLLFLLALAAIPGSVLPQRSSDPLAVNDWISRNPSGGTLDRLGLFDVFGSPWFSAVYILLFVSLIGCVLPRIGTHWRAIRGPLPSAPRRLDRLPGARSWSTDRLDVLTLARDALRAERWRVSEVAPGPNGAPTGSLTAEKGMAQEVGNLLFHVALVLILVGVALGALLGWKGTVIVREGAGFANTLTQYDSFSPGRLAAAERLPPFSFTLADFDATFEREGSQRGAPRSFSATLDYRAAPGDPAQQRVVSVNAPLRVDGAKVFLLGHGYAPRLRLTDSAGRVVLDDTVVFLPQDGDFTSTGVVKAPDASPQLGLQAILAPTAALDAVRGPHSTFPAPDDPALFVTAFTGDLGLDAGQPRNIFTLDTQGMEQVGIEALRPGDTWRLPGDRGVLEFVGLERWASFRISHDPGKGLALAAAVAALAGLGLSLFVRRRRIWVRVDPGAPEPSDGADHLRGSAGADPGSASLEGTDDRAGGSGALRVMVGGMARSEHAPVSDDVDRLWARLRPAIDSPEEP